MKAAQLNQEGTAWIQEIPVKEWYTIQDVCVILNAGGPSIYGAIKRGTMKGHRVNGVNHVKHENLLAYMARRAATPTFDPSQLDIQEILPEVSADKAAGAMAGPNTSVPTEEVNLDFLDED